MGSNTRSEEAFEHVYYKVADILIGTSGWSYKSWMKGTFYPAKMRAGDYFNFYAQQFPTVELNTTFYRLPSEDMVRGWRRKAPDGFIFAAKGSRFITQMKKLNVTADSIAIYFERVELLRDHLGPILWQLPPNFQKNTERLDTFLKMLPKKHHYAVEFRHPSWLDDETFAILRQHRAAHVPVSSRAMPMNFTLTTDFSYIRFHGLGGGFSHDYTRAELKPWADFCRKCRRNSQTVYVYFNNDGNVRAPKNAKEFKDMIG